MVNLNVVPRDFSNCSSSHRHRGNQALLKEERMKTATDMDSNPRMYLQKLPDFQFSFLCTYIYQLLRWFLRYMFNGQIDG